MCGIIGITGAREESVRKVLPIMRYRGPDDMHVVVHDQFTLGHVRLSIIDLDPRSRQPLEDVEGETIIVFNGEIYNYQSLREELETGYGVVFRTASDTEVLLQAYKVWGKGMVDRLSGMYAFAIHDRRTGRVFLASDQAAIKPIFYAHYNGAFMFASSLGGVVALLRDAGGDISVDPAAMSMYLTLGYVAAPRTLYAQIYRMPPATFATYTCASDELIFERLSLRRSDVATIDSLQDVVEASIESHLVADVPVGLFFSGGTDSSLIASILHKKGVHMKAYCGDIEGRPTDLEYAKKIAAFLGLDLTIVPFGASEFEEIYEEIVSRVDDPFADSSLFPTYAVARRAAKDVKVVLSGEGGDELFFGYDRSRRLRTMGDVSIDASVGVLERIFFRVPNVRGKHRLFEWLFRIARRPLAFYMLAVSPTKSLLTLAAWAETKARLAQVVTDASHLDADVYLCNDLLRKTDLATMFVSIEGRVPLLSKEVMSASYSLAQVADDSSQSKPKLRALLARYLPATLVERKKTGFGMSASTAVMQSTRMRNDLSAGVAYVQSLGVLRSLPDDVEMLLKKYPQVCWQVLFLYHSLRNMGVLTYEA